MVPRVWSGVQGCLPEQRLAEQELSNFLAVWVVFGWRPYSATWQPFPCRVGVCFEWGIVRGLWEVCLMRVPVGVYTCVYVTGSV